MKPSKISISDKEKKNKYSDPEKCTHIAICFSYSLFAVCVKLGKKNKPIFGNWKQHSDQTHFWLKRGSRNKIFTFTFLCIFFCW